MTRLALSKSWPRLVQAATAALLAAAVVSAAPVPPAHPRDLAHALELWLAGRLPREDLALLVEQPQPPNPVRVEIFGSGAGIWNGSRQFTLTAAQVDELARAFQRRGF